MALSSLKTKLQKLKKEDTNEITDYRTWMTKITSCGNRPEDWLEYTNYMRQNVTFNDRVQAHNFLSDLYEKAIRAINAKESKQNEAFAHLLIDFAEVKSDQLPDDALQLFTEARNITKKFAFVHIASAEFEIKEGNEGKAKKILEKARLFGAEPKELLLEALKKLESGMTVLMSPKHRKFNSQKKVLPSPLFNNTESKELTSSTQNMDITDPPQCQKEKCAPDEMETAPIMLETEKEKHFSVRANSCRPAMRTYNSTPEIRSMEKSQWKRKDIGLPQRVKKLNLPFTRETEKVEEEDTMAGFRPLEPQANSTFASVSVTQSSGYQSCQSMMESSIALETEKHPPDTNMICDISNIPPLHHSNVTDFTKHDEISLLKSAKPEIIIKSVPEENPPSNIQLSWNQTATNSLSNPKVPSEPTPSLPVEPTPSKNISSSVSNLPVCATPNVNNQQSVIMATPSSMMQDVKTLTVNNVVYMILEMIGRGGSSKVYHVHDSKTTSKAIKVVNLTDTNEEIVNGYKNEIKLLLQLQYCPKVIKLYDYEYRPEEYKLFIVMEYGNHDFAKLLKDTIKEEGKLSNHLIKFYWESMLLAVNALHKEDFLHFSPSAADEALVVQITIQLIKIYFSWSSHTCIIHSDLKPSNFILIGGKLKLIDFGIAKSVQPEKTSVMTDTQVGTLNYMSPESIMDYCDSGDKPMYKIGVKSDVWSLGCILYNMVYGYTPFQKIVKQFAKLQAIVNPNCVIHFPEIEDKLLMDVMKKCLIRDPKTRPGIEELLRHPYLQSEKEKPTAQTVADYKIERLVQKLADKFASSPNTVRSLVRSEIQKDTPDRDISDKDDVFGNRAPLKSLNLQNFL